MKRIISVVLSFLLIGILLGLSGPVLAQTETTYRYDVITTWVWDTSEPGMEYYRPPDGTLGSIDLRSLPEQGTPNVRGYGFFVMDRLPVDQPYILLSEGDKAVCLDIAVQPSNTRALETLWGIDISALTVRGLIWEMLVEDADSTGLLRWKPLEPDIYGVLRIELGGFSTVEFVQDQYSGADRGHLMGSWNKGK